MKYFEMNEERSIRTQNLLDAAKLVLKGNL